MELTVSQLAHKLGAELFGDGTCQISAVCPLQTADEQTVTFVLDKQHQAELKTSKAGAVIVGSRIDGCGKTQIIVKNVQAALIETLKIFAPQLKAPPPGIDPTAKIAKTAKIAGTGSIGPHVVVDENAQVGENTVIASGCRIGENSRIGNNCRFDSNVVVYHNCVIGNNVIIQANTTIGSTGFGYYFIDGSHRLIPHNGKVVIEDFVEIGANTCIDRAKFGETRIGAGTKVDNLVQIAHNVVIGKCCLIAGQVGIAGSTRLGDGVVMGGSAGAGDNLEIAAGTMAGARTVILQSTTEPGRVMFGTPALDKAEALRIFALSRRLPEMAEQLRQLSKKIEELEKKK
jgi:UDP-3-O-[3-hydroxymyristoyl] glucosamine N-acyltransferase